MNSSGKEVLELDKSKLVLIGGGTYKNTARSLIDLGLDITGKERPKMLVVPTAKHTEKSYNNSVKQTELFYASRGIKTDILHGYSEFPNEEELLSKIDEADMIYLSGGNTARAMEIWKKHKIDRMIARSALEGKVISGISAGVIAMFRDGMSDSQKFERKDESEPWNFINVNGVGLIDSMVTPHADSTDTPDGRTRYGHFIDNLVNIQKTTGKVEYGLSIDNNAALVAIDGLVRVVINRRNKRLHVAGSDLSYVDLDAPMRYLNSNHTNLPDDAISWQDFYQQLHK